jgi:hypothetical protein
MCTPEAAVADSQSGHLPSLRPSFTELTSLHPSRRVHRSRKHSLSWRIACPRYSSIRGSSLLHLRAPVCSTCTAIKECSYPRTRASLRGSHPRTGSRPTRTILPKTAQTRHRITPLIHGGRRRTIKWKKLLPKPTQGLAKPGKPPWVSLPSHSW